MNYGQRQGNVSVAIAAGLRRLAGPKGGQEWDKLSRPYGKTFFFLGDWTAQISPGALWGDDQGR